MRYQGKVFNWNDDKGFGFVESNGGGERAFVHIKAFNPRSRRPIDGDIIIYDVVQGDSHRAKAANIQFSRDATGALIKRPNLKNVHSKNSGKNSQTGQSRRSKGKAQSYTLANTFILLFCVGIVLSVLLGPLPPVVGGIYMVMSVIAFLAYAIDKNAAQKGRWRTKESTLHLYALLGGWPGALLAQNKLRHKSSKNEFKQVYWLTVVLNLGALYWLHTEEGIQFLNRYIVPIFDGLL
ncbi:hypothetical protein FX988_04241 [Paraglaciecola mesophila]|uniref:CSD domain-containing protein n=1 Tax=Paraglaciecola mesophila TaxID=197222 RepID=A0A857JRX3_9ALTE|nr:DUF1294 domain-containing protein [Paraglaciecola mesophila]QHJ13960.1 hypothetical protein FX988_04241 [Paraglaciecola mesophila]